MTLQGELAEYADRTSRTRRARFTCSVRWGVMAGLRRWPIVMLLALTSLDVHAEALEAERGEESQVKAAFLYNFVKFIQWPPLDGRSTSDVVICVVARNPFNGVLDAIVRGKTVNGRTIVVRQFKDGDDPRLFHVIFISAAEAHRREEILARVRGVSVLTVGETPHFLREGGVVELFIENNRLRFRINATAANLAGLRISSQLLSLAKQ